MSKEKNKEKMEASENLGFSIDVSELKFNEGQTETTIQVLPFGEWKHPSYGNIEIGKSAMKEFMDNFNNGVRNDIPITEGHSVGGEEKPAVGWFKELINKGRDGLWAVVDWTKEGRELIESSAYKYFSPEFYTQYEDPETHNKHNNVLVGGALTNKPYFKELAMVLSEQTNLDNMSEKEKEELEEKEEKEEKETEEKPEATEEEPKEEESPEEEEEKEEKVEGSEGSVMIQASVLSELERKAEKGVSASEKLEKMEIDRATEELIFSESNRSGKLLPKSRDKVKALLSSLDEGQRKQFREVLADLPSTKLFSELGGSSDEPTSAREKLDSGVKKLMSEDSSLGYRDAVSQVFAEKPELKKELGY